jgi:hypothetical protein
MKIQLLLILTAVLETLTGISLLLAPAFIVQLLLGSEISTETEFTICRIGGSALIALGMICWLARQDVKSGASKALVGGLFVYNALVFITLANSAYIAQTTPALISALVVHLALGIACIFQLRKYKIPA